MKTENPRLQFQAGQKGLRYKARADLTSAGVLVSVRRARQIKRNAVDEPFSTACSGFTLVEVTIAITLLAMMVLMLYGSFHLGERAATKAAARAEESQKLRTRQEFLAGYIRSAYPYRPMLRDPSVYFSGAEGGLEFISSLSNGLGGRGLSKVRVTWESAGTLTLEEEMPARVSPPGSLSPQASAGGYRNRLVLAEMAGQFRMEYLDSQSDVESWVVEWDGGQRKALPRAVRMTYRDERGEEVRWTFPVMMSALAP